MRNKLKKDRVLSPNPSVEKFINDELASFTASFDAVSVEGKMRNKLLSSKSFSSEMGALIEGLRAILQPREAEDEEEEAAEPEPVVKQKKPKKGEKKTAPSRDTVDGAEESDDVQVEEDDAGWESGSIDDANDAGFESGSVKAQIIDEDGWESGSIDGGEHPDTLQDDDSDSGSEADPSDSDSDLAVPRPSTSKSKNLNASSSTFLPSLSVGFIPGGNDSDSDDFSDADAKSADPVRKNRRGQRARQA